MEDVNRLVNFLNSLFYETPNLVLSGVSLVVKNHETQEEFEIEFDTDPDIGRLEVTIDPDYYADPRYGDCNEAVMLGTADGFDMIIEAKHCQAWRLSSNWGKFHEQRLQNNNPVEILESDRDV